MENQVDSNWFSLAVWSKLRPEDFDGHTEFARMDPEQRLIWLSEVARFVHDARQWREADASSRLLD
jgi:hypothetical protein